MYDDIDLAWFAGLFEGEGYFTFNKGVGTGIAIGMTDLDVLEKVQTKFGGKISVAYEATDKWKKCWKWSLYSLPAARLITAIYPYLLSRRKEKAEIWLRNRDNLDKKLIQNEQVKILIKEGVRPIDIAKKFGMTRHAVGMIKNRIKDLD